MKYHYSSSLQLIITNASIIYNTYSVLLLSVFLKEKWKIKVIVQVQYGITFILHSSYNIILCVSVMPNVERWLKIVKVLMNFLCFFNYLLNTCSVILYACTLEISSLCSNIIIIATLKVSQLHSCFGVYI